MLQDTHSLRSYIVGFLPTRNIILRLHVLQDSHHSKSNDHCVLFKTRSTQNRGVR